MPQLSPLNLISVINLARAAKADEAEPCNRVKMVMAYRCKSCNELHEWEDEAADCCKPAAPHRSASACPCCGKPYMTHRDAADCCLWHDLDALTRWAIADAVEAGSDWVTELGLAEKVGSGETAQ